MIVRVKKQGEGTCCVDVPVSRSAWQLKGGGCLLAAAFAVDVGMA
jgi:hypothetical protein